MSFIDVMHEYFRGEKMAAFTMIAVGVGFAAFAGWVAKTQAPGLAWGLALPLALVGAGAAIGGGVFAWKTGKQVDEIVAAHERDPDALVRAESERMTRVNANWPRLKTTWAVVIVIALGLLFFVKRDWSQGLGLALLLLATTVMFVDVFGERRARPYAEALSREAGTGGVAPPVTSPE